MNNSVKARIKVLQSIAAQKQNSVAIMSILPDGTWAACRGSGTVAKTFETEQAAQTYLTGCDTIIVIDL